MHNSFSLKAFVHKWFLAETLDTGTRRVIMIAQLRLILNLA